MSRSPLGGPTDMDVIDLAEDEHLPPLDWGTLWRRGHLCFETGPTTRKGRNLARDRPVEVDGSGSALTAPFTAPGAGRPPWSVQRVDATWATVLGTVGEGGATRFRF